MLPGKTTVPLIVNHDDDRVVGSVRSFSQMDDTDGPWLVAPRRSTGAPEWLRKRETKASFAYCTIFVNEDVLGCEVVRDAWVTEVSLLSPDRRPREPGRASSGCGSKPSRPGLRPFPPPEAGGRRWRRSTPGRRRMPRLEGRSIGLASAR